MRWRVLGIGIALGGCYMGPASPDDPDDAGASACDGKESCDECLACANAEPCAEIISRCIESSPCAAIDQCIPLCGADATCQQQCITNNPSGAALYDAAQDCRYCEQCPGDCAGYRDCS